eukprot:Amastigsp_a2020_32.p6 type:complete len:143 gc:universal Amastigsp_a2020_32:1438-1866(+)
MIAPPRAAAVLPEKRVSAMRTPYETWQKMHAPVTMPGFPRAAPDAECPEKFDEMMSTTPWPKSAMAPPAGERLSTKLEFKIVCIESRSRYIAPPSAVATLSVNEHMSKSVRDVPVAKTPPPFEPEFEVNEHRVRLAVDSWRR